MRRYRIVLAVIFGLVLLISIVDALVVLLSCGKIIP